VLVSEVDYFAIYTQSKGVDKMKIGCVHKIQVCYHEKIFQYARGYFKY